MKPSERLTRLAGFRRAIVGDVRLTDFQCAGEFVANAYLPDGRIISIHDREIGRCYYQLGRAVAREIATAKIAP